MYQIKCDTHTHTIASAHAYCTITEMASAAAKKGLTLIAMTDHGPALPDSTHIMHFQNLKILPRMIDGVFVLRGVEANLIDFTGEIDMEPALLKRLDWVIASAHDLCLTPGTVEDHTRMYLGLAENELVDVVGHCGDERFRFDYERVIPVLAESGKCIEINNHSFELRPGSDKNCREIIRICKEHRARIVVNTDAHFWSELGVFDHAYPLLEEVSYPEELIVNRSRESVLDFIKYKKGVDLGRFV